MVEETRSYPLLTALMKRTRLPWYWATAVVAAVLLLFLILVEYLDGTFVNLLDWRFWQNHLDGIVNINYILVVYPFMWRLREQAVQAFRTLLPLDEAAFNALAEDISKPKRRWE